MLLQMAYACMCVVRSRDEREDMNRKILHTQSSEGLQNQNNMYHVLLQQISQMHLKITSYNNFINYGLSGPKMWNI